MPLLRKEFGTIELPTYSSLQTVKYWLGMESSSEQMHDAPMKLLAVDNHVLDHPRKNLMRNMNLAYITHSKVKQGARKGMQNGLQQRSIAGQATLMSKCKAQEQKTKDAKRLKTLHLHYVMKKRKHTRQKATSDRNDREKRRQQKKQ